MAEPVQPLSTDNRQHQMFPKLTEAEIDRLRRFGEIRHYDDGAMMFKAGEVGPGMFVMIGGSRELPPCGFGVARRSSTRAGRIPRRIARSPPTALTTARGGR